MDDTLRTYARFSEIYYFLPPDIDTFVQVLTPLGVWKRKKIRIGTVKSRLNKAELMWRHPALPILLIRDSHVKELSVISVWFMNTLNSFFLHFSFYIVFYYSIVLLVFYDICVIFMMSIDFGKSGKYNSTFSFLLNGYPDIRIWALFQF